MRLVWRADTIAAWLMTLVAVAVFGLVLAHATVYAPEAEQVPQEASVASVYSTGPLRLKIPTLGIDALVEHVGLSYKGNIGIPSNFTNVAWYKKSVVPGNPGTAIMNGHVDNGLAMPGVFKHLNDLKPGDEIAVENANGIVRFVVYEVQSYPYEEVPMQSILANKGRPELTLISCDGGWVQGARTYDHRLVVFAKEVTSIKSKK